MVTSMGMLSFSAQVCESASNAVTTFKCFSALEERSWRERDSTECISRTSDRFLCICQQRCGGAAETRHTRGAQSTQAVCSRAHTENRGSWQPNVTALERALYTHVHDWRCAGARCGWPQRWRVHRRAPCRCVVGMGARVFVYQSGSYGGAGIGHGRL